LEPSFGISVSPSLVVESSVSTGGTVATKRRLKEVDLVGIVVLIPVFTCCNDGVLVVAKEEALFQVAVREIKASSITLLLEGRRSRTVVMVLNCN
jgi:hypothetical protein